MTTWPRPFFNLKKIPTIPTHLGMRAFQSCQIWYDDHRPKIKNTFIGLPPALADKSDNIFYFCGNTSSNRAGAWSHQEFALIFPTTQQSSSFSMSWRTSPIAASDATNVKNVIRFFRQCKLTLYLYEEKFWHVAACFFLMSMLDIPTRS